MRHAPMLLPWLARRAGLDDKAALAAWREALRAGDRRFGRDRRSPEYWGFVVGALRRGIEARRCAHAMPMGRCAPVARLAAVGMEAAFELAHIALRAGFALARPPRRGSHAA